MGPISREYKGAMPPQTKSPSQPKKEDTYNPSYFKATIKPPPMLDCLRVDQTVAV